MVLLPITSILMLIMEVIRVPQECGNPLCSEAGLLSFIGYGARQDVTYGAQFWILKTALGV